MLVTLFRVSCTVLMAAEHNVSPPVPIRIGSLQVSSQYHHDYKAELPAFWKTRWINLSGPRNDWFGSTYNWLGKNPAFNVKKSVYTIELEPAEFVGFRVEPQQIVKISNLDKKIQRNDILASISNGSGLQVATPLYSSEFSSSLFVVPDSSQPTFCFIKRPDHFSSSIEITLYMSHREDFSPLNTARNIVDLPLETISVNDDLSFSQKMWVLPALKKTTIELNGPGSLILEHRLIYMKHETGRRAHYRVAVTSDSNNDTILEFENLPELNRMFSIDETPSVLGRISQSVTHIAAGKHKLTFQSTRTLAMRLLNQQKPAYLLPNINAPDIGTQKQIAQKNIFSIPGIWGARATLTHTSKINHNYPGMLVQTARFIAMNNLFQPGGLKALDILKKGSQELPQFKPFLDKAKSLIRHNTFYRNAIPVTKSGAFPQRFYYVTTPRLKVKSDRHLVVASQHNQKMIATLNGAYFNALQLESQGASGGFVYKIPQRSGNSRLRLLAMYPDQPVDLVLSYDTGISQTITVQPEPLLPDEAYKLTIAEASLTNINRQFHSQGSMTLNGPLGIYKDFPAPLKQIAHFDFHLPQNVREVVVRRLHPEKSTVWLGVQYQDAKFYQMNESDFLSALALLGGQKNIFNLFKEWVRSKNNPPVLQKSSLQILAKRDLQNHYLPLIQHLRSLRQSFMKNSEPFPSEEASSQTMKKESLNALVQKALQAEQAGQWIAALEHWATLKKNATGSLYQRAVFKHIGLLPRVGEHYLAEMALKSLILSPVGEYGTALSERAYYELVKMYSANNTSDKLLALYATKFLNDFSPELIEPLASLLFQNNSISSSLLLSLLNPDKKLSSYTLHGASQLLGWIQLFQQTLDNIESIKDKDYWHALLLLRQGNIDKALETLEKDNGDQNLRKYIHEASDILDEVQTSDTLQPETLKRWQSWQREHPGPFVWQNGAHLATGFSASALLFSKTRHLYGNSFLSTNKMPVRINVTGPVTLQVTARPLHTSQSLFPLNDWILLQDGKRKGVFPISNNFPSNEIEVIGKPKKQVGQRVVFEYEVDSGDHELIIRGKNTPLFVQLKVKRPAFPIPLLPQITPETILALQGNNNSSEIISAKTLSCYLGDCLKVINYEEENFIYEVSESRLRKRMRNISRDNYGVRVKPELEQQKILTNDELKQNARISCSDKNIIAEKCLANLNRLAEYSVDKDPWVYNTAKNVHHESIHNPNLTPYSGRKALQGKWEPLSLVVAESGIRYLPYENWNPASPSLRVRKTIVPETSPEEELLFDNTRLIYSSDFDTETNLDIRVRLLEIPYLKPFPLTVDCILDGELFEKINLERHKSEAIIPVQLSPGEHHLSFHLKRRYTNQFLTVKVSASPGEIPDKVDLIRKSAFQKERAYFVATKHNPVKANILGPAFIRFDSLHEEVIYSTYKYFDTGWHTVNLKPEGNRKEKLYRIYKWQIREKESTQTALMRQPSPPGPGLPQQTNVQLSTPFFPDYYPYFPQTDFIDVGTFELTSRFERRRLFDEDQDTTIEEFTNFGLIHRKKSDWLPGYFQTKGFGRFRQNGGPLLGFGERISLMPRSLPFTIRLRGNIWLQNPNSSQYDFHEAFLNPEWSIKLIAGISKKYTLGDKVYHIPSVSLFQRFLSLKDNHPYQISYLDKDIFSSYKNDHRHGLNLQDTWHFIPWLDTRLFFGFGLGTNEIDEYFEPDYINFQTGLKQIIWPFQVNFQYRGTQYLEDNDRRSLFYRDLAELDVTWDLLLSTRNWLQAGIKIQKYTDSDELAGFLFVSCYFNDETEYINFRPTEVDFREIKSSKRILLEHQDMMKDDQWK